MYDSKALQYTSPRSVCSKRDEIAESIQPFTRAANWAGMSGPSTSSWDSIHCLPVTDLPSLIAYSSLAEARLEKARLPILTVDLLSATLILV